MVSAVLYTFSRWQQCKVELEPPPEEAAGTASLYHERLVGNVAMRADVNALSEGKVIKAALIQVAHLSKLGIVRTTNRANCMQGSTFRHVVNH